jgi:LacI family transcriptional regulator
MKFSATVIIDDKQAAYEAVQSLIDKEEKIALVTTVDYVSVGKLRTDGYIKALLDNVPFNENLIIKIEDVDTCEIIIGKYWKTKPSMPFCRKRAFAVTIIKTANKIVKCT